MCLIWQIWWHWHEEKEREILNCLNFYRRRKFWMESAAVALGFGPRKTRARQGHLSLWQPDLDSKENHLHGKLKSWSSGQSQNHHHHHLPQAFNKTLPTFSKWILKDISSETKGRWFCPALIGKFCCRTFFCTVIEATQFQQRFPAQKRPVAKSPRISCLKWIRLNPDNLASVRAFLIHFTNGLGAELHFTTF